MENAVHYKVFKNDAELTKFQEGDNIGIVSITPFSSGLKMELETKEANGEIEVGVFVVYYNKKS